MSHSNKHKEIRLGASIPEGKRIVHNQNPDSILQYHPSWAFNKVDFEGKWGFSNEDFWSIILPQMRQFESQTWAEISSAKKQNHTISIEELNKCARDRLEKLNIFEDEIFSLRFDGTTRLYGLRETNTFVILWYDNKHGDNDTCVCRSHKKGT